MKWFALCLLIFCYDPISCMELDLLKQIPDEHAKKVSARIRRGTGPKKLLNLVERSCNGNLALKAYVFGKTWKRAADTWEKEATRKPDPNWGIDHYWRALFVPYHKSEEFFDKIYKEAEQQHDLLAIEVTNAMKASFLNNGDPKDYAIQFDAVRALGFLIQMGESVTTEDLSATISNRQPRLTALLLQAHCPVEDCYDSVRRQPMVIALKMGDEATASLLLPKLNLNQTYFFGDELRGRFTIKAYLELEYPMNHELGEINYRSFSDKYFEPDYSQARALLEKLKASKS